LTIEASGCGSKGGCCGTSKFTYKDKSFGEVEETFKTTGAVDGKIKLTKLADNTTVTVSGNQDYDFKCEADYKMDAFAAQFDIDTNMASALQLSANVVDGLAVACRADFDFSNGADLKDWNVGGQYAFSKNLILSSVTSKGRSKATMGVLYKRNCCESFAINQCLNTSTFESSLAVGYERKIDDSMTMKCKIGTCGAFAMALEHKLASPKLKVNFAAEFDAFNSGAGARKTGLGLVFGDY
jgi:hypothetical protein